MKAPTTIRLLAAGNNARGDLFTRLVKDLFFALGYDDLRLDVAKSGRELDIVGSHRLEPRRMVAECKAHKAKIGGDDLNKLQGVLVRERDRNKETPVTGYFVSLGGFRETAREQEAETGEQNRLILMDGARLLEELQRVNALVGHTEAAERAGRCAEHADLSGAELEGVELLGHEEGYVWAVYYAQGKVRSHFALIRADGTPLANGVAAAVVEADRACRGKLHTLAYLPPPAPAPDRAALGEKAVARYRQWLSEECGHIQLDGLPADTVLSATKMRLERLFVPLKLVTEVKKEHEGEARKEERIDPVGRFLADHPHLALLATPGGGKSTLLKRLAVAYADPDRRTEMEDALPDRNWLPLFLRCRDLRDRARRPILELLDDLPSHACMDGKESAVFHEEMHEALRDGQVLLLLDGLDEISDEGDRRTFAHHLRTFLAMFPKVALVVTSRQAGYRHVAGVIAGSCVQAKLAPFDEGDVKRLCVGWHAEVVGDNDKVRTEAEDLAGDIWDNERIRALAENPHVQRTYLGY